jgi:hypothetical protein
MEDSVMVYTVEVRTSGGRDTLTDVLTPLPIVVGDSLVVGLRLNRTGQDEAGRLLFRRQLASDSTETWPLPSDVWFYYHDVVPSPDGRYFAYIAREGFGTVAVVRELETGREIVRGGAGGGCECDVDRNHARWFAPDSFEIAVYHIDPGWQIVAGRASTRTAAVTRLEQEPAWHEQSGSR